MQSHKFTKSQTHTETFSEYQAEKTKQNIEAELIFTYSKTG